MKKINLMFLFLVLISNYIISQDTKLEYSEATGELSLTNIPKPMNSTNLKKKPCWNIHWELGDGYSFFEDGVCGSSHTIKHFYRRKGIFKITVFFTPIYALGTHEPISITVQIRNVRKKVKEEIDIPDKKIVNIISNVNKEIIARHSARIAIQHKNDAQKNSSGTLIFFCNAPKEEDQLHVRPFKMEINSEGLYYGNQLVKSSWNKFLSRFPEVAKGIQSTYAKQYLSSYIYRSEGLFPGEVRQLFLTLVGNKNLAKKLDKKIKLTISALWIPDGSRFYKSKNESIYTFSIEKIHDPNRIKVDPRIVAYRKGYPKEMTYNIQIKNSGKGTVIRAKIRLGISKDLDMETIRLDSSQTNPTCSICRPGFDKERDRCIEIEKKILNQLDSLIFTFHNIGLEGKKKANIVFRIKSKDRRPKFTILGGEVHFEGNSKPKTLNDSKLKWVKRSWGINVGYNIFPRIKGFTPVDGNVLGNFEVGINRQFSGVGKGKGWTYGVELHYFANQFQKVNSFEIVDEFLTTGSYQQVEVFRTHEIGIRVMGGIQVNNFIALKALGGLSLPVWTRLDLQGNVNGYIDQTSVNLGLFQKIQSTSFFDNDLDISKIGMGFQSGLVLEVGDIHSLMGGISYTQGFYPWFYHNACAFSTRVQLNLKIQFKPIGGKR